METILLRYLGETEYLINPIQPEVALVNGLRKQTSGGGWSQVLSHCNETKFTEILQLNDYLVVQIDTDACQQYGVEQLDFKNRNKICPFNPKKKKKKFRACVKIFQNSF